MIENTKCECGHQNSIGTLLCESCGKPMLEEDDGVSSLEMRYDGVARRSQKANPNLIDHVWNFFASVKIAVYLIIITLVAAALGTIYPQRDAFIGTVPQNYYLDNYGTLGHIYHVIGLSNVFGSWWFKLLLVMIGASLVVCSLDRVLPLYRALTRQQIRKHLSFIIRQKVSHTTKLDYKNIKSGADVAGETLSDQQWIEQFAGHARKKGYKVHFEEGALLAEKNRFSRWGPYINHIGLIVLLLAILLRMFPGMTMDTYVTILEGETVPIEGTPYFIKNEKFTVEFYDQDELQGEYRENEMLLAKLFETQAVLYECIDDCEGRTSEVQLQEVARHDVVLNKPLKYKSLRMYQFDYEVAPQVRSIQVHWKNKESGESFGPFELKTRDPEAEYKAGPYTLTLRDYLPEFGVDEEGKPTNLSSETPNAPAFIFQIHGPELAEEGEVYIYFPLEIDKQRFSQDHVNGALAEKWEISANSMEDVDIAMYKSTLNVRVDRAVGWIFVGGIISMIGLTMGFYWNHRRIWLRIDKDVLSFGAHTNKNWFSLRKEAAALLKKAGIDVDQQELDKGGKEA